VKKKKLRSTVVVVPPAYVFVLYPSFVFLCLGRLGLATVLFVCVYYIITKIK
jgi:hypothetical protein